MVKQTKTPVWFEIVVEVVGDTAEDVSVLLAEEGCAGSELRTLSGGASAVVVSTEAASLAAAQAEAASLCSNLPTDNVRSHQVNALDEQVWTENWRDHFPPLALGRRLEVIPPWESPGCTRAEQVPEDAVGDDSAAAQEPVGRASPRGTRREHIRGEATADDSAAAQEATRHASPSEATSDAAVISIVINPAMAFGTGHHETTAGCLELIEELLREGDRVADIGCGSGILSIAAAKLGASRVRAFDIDEEALNATRDNAVTNGVAHLIDVADADDTRRSTYETEDFDLVVANIVAETLIELRGALTSCVNDGGHLLLSGIERKRLPLVEKAFIDSSWRLSRERPAGEWASIALHKIPADSRDQGLQTGQGIRR